MRRKDDHKVVEKVRMIDEDAIIGKQTERPAELDFYENPELFIQSKSPRNSGTCFSENRPSRRTRSSIYVFYMIFI